MRGWLRPLCLCLVSPPSVADGVALPALPEPLTLTQALASIDEQHPALLSARLEGQYAQLDFAQAQADDRLRVDLRGRLRWIDANTSPPGVNDTEDHRLSLVVSKPLYDGGFADAGQRAAQAAVASADVDYAYERQRYAIIVMRRFFDVILADLQSMRDTEAMATAFVSLDRGRDNHELGRLSDVDLLALHDTYQEMRLKAYMSEGAGRTARQLLALALNRPAQPPTQLQPPLLDFEQHQLPDYAELLRRALADNPRLMAFDHAVAAARSRVKVADADAAPRVTGLLEHATQSRATSSDHKWRVGVEWTAPLYDGGLGDVKMRRAQLDLNQKIYERYQYEYELRAQLRDLVEQYRVLRATYEGNQVFSDYRQLYMDRSRTLYELEVKTDLGDAMVQISESHLRDTRQTFEMALLLAQLNLLVGEPLTDWDALSTVKQQTVEDDTL